MIQDRGVTIPSRMFGVSGAIGATEEYIPFCSVKRCFLISHIARFVYNEMKYLHTQHFSAVRMTSLTLCQTISRLLCNIVDPRLDPSL